jgi:hypothetical protein
MAERPVEGDAFSFCRPPKSFTSQREVSMTKAQEVFEKVNTLIDGGMNRPDAFKQVAGEYEQPVNSIRGSYYSYSRGATGGGASRPRRRETTAETALEDARAALERALVAIDRETEAADDRAKEAALEAKALKDSATERKAAITERLEALK